MKTLLIILTVLGAIVGFGSLTLMLTSSANPTHLEKLVPLLALGVSIISAFIQLDTAATEIVEHLSTEKSLRRKLDDRLVEIIELQRVIKEMKIKKILDKSNPVMPEVCYPLKDWTIVASKIAADKVDSRVEILAKEMLKNLENDTQS